MGQNRRGRMKNSEQPLKGKKFFVDVAGKEAAEVREALGLLGGAIVTFLDKEVDFLISSKPEAKNARQQGAASAPSPFGQSRLSDSPCNPDSPATGDNVKKKALSRGKEIAQKAHVTKYYGSCNILKNAEQLGIKVVYTEHALRWLREKCKAVPRGGNTSEQEVRSRRSHSSGVVRLESPFVKYESANMSCRPVYREFEVWPQLQVLTNPGSCPFEASKPRQHASHDSGARKRSEKPSARVSGDVTSGWRRPAEFTVMTAGEYKRLQDDRQKKEKKKGFCEGCQMKFDDLAQHLLTSQHQQYSRRADNYSSLDMLKKEGPNMEKFLHDVMLYHPEHAQQGQKEFKTFPPPVSSACEEEALKQPSAVPSPRKTRVKRQAIKQHEAKPAAAMSFQAGGPEAVSPGKANSSRVSSRPASGRARGGYNTRRRNSCDTPEQQSFVKGAPTGDLYSWYQDSLACSEQLPASTMSPLLTRGPSQHPSGGGDPRPRPYPALPTHNSGVGVVGSAGDNEHWVAPTDTVSPRKRRRSACAQEASASAPPHADEEEGGPRTRRRRAPAEDAQSPEMTSIAPGDSCSQRQPTPPDIELYRPPLPLAFRSPSTRMLPETGPPTLHSPAPALAWPSPDMPVLSPTPYNYLEGNANTPRRVTRSRAANQPIVSERAVRSVKRGLFEGREEWGEVEQCEPSTSHPAQAVTLAPADTCLIQSGGIILVPTSELHDDPFERDDGGQEGDDIVEFGKVEAHDGSVADAASKNIAAGDAQQAKGSPARISLSFRKKKSDSQDGNEEWEVESYIYEMDDSTTGDPSAIPPHKDSKAKAKSPYVRLKARDSKKSKLESAPATPRAARDSEQDDLVLEPRTPKSQQRKKTPAVTPRTRTPRKAKLQAIVSLSQESSEEKVVRRPVGEHKRATPGSKRRRGGEGGDVSARDNVDSESQGTRYTDCPDTLDTQDTECRNFTAQDAEECVLVRCDVTDGPRRRVRQSVRRNSQHQASSSQQLEHQSPLPSRRFRSPRHSPPFTPPRDDPDAEKPGEDSSPHSGATRKSSRIKLTPVRETEDKEEDTDLEVQPDQAGGKKTVYSGAHEALRRENAARKKGERVPEIEMEVNEEEGDVCPPDDSSTASGGRWMVTGSGSRLKEFNLNWIAGGKIGKFGARRSLKYSVDDSSPLRRSPRKKVRL